MKRAELAKITGFSEGHISHIAPGIPGAVLRGKQYEFDETDPEFQKWLMTTFLKMGSKLLRKQRLMKRQRRAPRSLPKPRPPRSLPEIIKTMNELVIAFEKCRSVLPKIRISERGVQFREKVSFQEWRESFEFLLVWRRGPSLDELAEVSAHLEVSEAQQLFVDYFNALMQFHNLSGGEPLPVEEAHAAPGASLIRPKKSKSVSSSEFQSA